MVIIANMVDLVQGSNDEGYFGYVAGDNGGLFFTWRASVEETVDSLEVDSQDGDGGLDLAEVKTFLCGYLPTTSKGRKVWGWEDE
jgi:hypothetical protein